MPSQPSTPITAETTARSGWRPAEFIRLARVRQWSKGAFVLVGPVYAVQDHAPDNWWAFISAALLATLAFGLASSACYVLNDLADAEADRAHPRKRLRPIASGAIRPVQAKVFAACLFVGALIAVAALPRPAVWIVGAIVAVYSLNVVAYSAIFKSVVIADVMSLSLGFVLRVFAGCAAIGIAPTTWLLNVTLFLAMLLSFGKRLGERRMLGRRDAARARRVQGMYSDDLLRMAVVVTGVATLLTYAAYVTERAEEFTRYGVNWLWLTILPATYGLLRAITLLERGRYDDPTELAHGDRAFQASGVLFVLMTLTLLWLRMSGALGPAAVGSG